MPPKALDQAAAKKAVIEAIGQGATVVAALQGVGRALKTYEAWRANDKAFAAAVDVARERAAADKERGVTPAHRQMDFASWRKEFLGQDTYPHQQNWIDVLEGRDPKIAPGCRYVPAGRGRRVLINTPPFHAKSTTITVEYVVYRICMNPNVRVIIVSKTLDQAKKFLYAIKQRLTSPMFAKLQAAYAPPEGFKGPRGDAWTSTQIYVAGRETGEKDPTVEALGMGGQIYGARADLIILDDVVTLKNASEWSKQMDWINQEVSSRLKDGTLAVVGTRVASADLYTALLDGDNYLSGKSPWTYLGQPAVLSYADDPKDWVTLWPKSTQPLDENEQEPGEDGLYDAWSGPALSEVRDNVSPKTWALVYMQQSVSEDNVFDPICVQGSVTRRRKPGPLVVGALDHPPRGMEGQYVIASMDPAMTGDTFTLVGAVDRQSGERRIMNAWVKPSPTPQYIRELIKDVTVTYQVNEWVIEQNAFQLFLIHDPEIQKFLSTRGVKLTPHYTSRNKQDPDFGVASCAPLFGTTRTVEEAGGRKIHVKGSNLITLPDPDYSEGVKALIEQLITWEPGKLGKDLKQDGPMALWFFELRARNLLGYGKADTQTSYMQNPYLSRSDKRKRVIVPMQEYRAG